MAGKLGSYTDEQLAVLVLPGALATWGEEVGAARLSRVLMAAGLQLATDVDGEAAAWEVLRGMLANAAERARVARHPRPRPANTG